MLAKLLMAEEEMLDVHTMKVDHLRDNRITKVVALRVSLQESQKSFGRKRIAPMIQVSLMSSALSAMEQMPVMKKFWQHCAAR